MRKVRGGTPEGITSQIFAIGGGDLPTRETFDIDKMIVESSGRARPWTLCITAAANDSPEACDAFGNIYGDALRCRTDYLRMIKGEPGGDDYKRKIHRSEVFYFSDGDPELLMKTLDQYDVVPLLVEAYRRGAVFGGIGAGAVALGQFGYIANKGAKSFSGIGAIDFGLCSVPTSAGDQDKACQAEAASHKKSAFVLGYLTTLHVLENDFRILTDGGSAKLVTPDGAITEVESKVELQSLDSLGSKKAGTKVKA